MPRRILLLWTIIATFLSVNVAPAQMSGRGTQTSRLPVLVVVTSQFDGPGSSVILRRSNETPHDVIILRADSANAEVLSQAIVSLMRVRTANATEPPPSGVVRVRTQRGGPPVVIPWTEKVIRDLRQAPERSISGIGKARAIEIWLPRRMAPQG